MLSILNSNCVSSRIVQYSFRSGSIFRHPSSTRFLSRNAIKNRSFDRAILELSKPIVSSGSSSKGMTTAVLRKNLKLGVQGAPLDKGQAKLGVADGPKICRSSGFIELLRETVGLDVKDYGDIQLGVQSHSHLIKDPDFEGKSDEIKETLPEEIPNAVKSARNAKEVAAANKAISEATSKVLRDGRICLTLGGDHSIGIGTLQGASEVYNELAVLWVDAHADINTVQTSQSGNMHGMPLAFVIKELSPYMDKIPEFSWVTQRISAKNLAYIALRDVDDAERAILELLGVKAYSMKEVDRFGIRKVTQMALEHITPGNKRPLHVSFDIDSLDDREVITTGTPVPGGLTLREGLTLMEEINEAGNLVSMDFVEVNHLLGNALDRKRTVNVVKQLLVTAFGYYRGGISASPNVPIANTS